MNQGQPFTNANNTESIGIASDAKIHNEDKTWRATLYLRLSKDDGDKEESESITNQRSLLLSHVQGLPNVTIVSEKIDDGWSGANFQRPAFIEMIKEIREGKTDCVIVKDLTRFGRNFGESGKYIEHVFPFLGVRFISVNDGIDSANKKSRSDDIVVPFLNLISDAYCRDISIKIRSQLEIKRKKGDFVGAFAVFGYKRDECNHNRLVIDEPAADIVKMIFRWKLDGLSAEGIAKKLNALGVLSPLAYKKLQGLKFSTPFAGSLHTKWSAVAVIRILKDEIYKGMMVQGKTSTPNHKIRKKIQKPEENWVRVDGTHEPIIDTEDFDLVARLIKHDTRISPGSEAVYPFSGIVKCGICGENMIRKTSHTSVRVYIYLVCCQRCKGSSINEQTFMDCVKTVIHSYLCMMDIDRVLKFIDCLSLEYGQEKRLYDQLSLKQAEIKRYARLIDSLHENRQNGIINEFNYSQMYTHYTTLHNETEQSINNILNELKRINSSEKSQWLKQFCKNPELTRRIVVSLIDLVNVHPKSRLEIAFRYQ